MKLVTLADTFADDSQTRDIFTVSMPQSYNTLKYLKYTLQTNYRFLFFNWENNNKQTNKQTKQKNKNKKQENKNKNKTF